MRLAVITALGVTNSGVIRLHSSQEIRASTICPPIWAHSMLETILVIVLILWLLGFSFHIGGNFVHVLLVIALIVFLIRLLA